MTIWCPASYTLLKVWKASSCVTALAGDELYVVHQQQVHVAVLLPELFASARAHGVNEFVCEVVALEVSYFEFRVVAENLLAYCEQQVSFAETMSCRR